MKKISTPLYGLIVLTLLLSACNLPIGSAAAPVEESLATLELPPTPTIEPFVPEAPTIGSTISWFDTSTLVFVPGGGFTMGADEPEKKDFNPAHPVEVGGFWIYSTKVTNEMYNLCVSLGQCTPEATNAEKPGTALSGTFLFGYFTSPGDAGYSLKDLPVTNVIWDQADNYCKWVGGRLPTEAEWEKTARGTKIQTYPWGDEPAACNFLNFKECGQLLSSVLDHPEGISDYKALDMAGNAYEWVNDWYAKDFYAQSPASNPTGPADGEMRSVRGSSFDTGLDSVFSAQRSSLEPDQYKTDVGFRCVIEDPTVFAPVCEAPAAIFTDAGNPQPGQSVSGVDGSPASSESIVASQIPVKISSFCANPSIPFGGVSATIDRSLLDVNCPYDGKGDNWSIYYTAHPKSKGTIDGGLDIASSYANNSSIMKLVFFGKEGEELEVHVDINDCSIGSSIKSPPQGALAICAAGYTLQSNGTCLYTGTSGQPASVSCPGGYSYNSETQCCTQNPPQAGNQPSQYPACGPGNIFDPLQKVCFKKPINNNTNSPSSMVYELRMGTCDEPKPKDSDKPSQPQQPEPTPCVIDPFTGACH